MTIESVLFTNNQEGSNASKLSIVTPFLGDDPSGWIDALVKSEFASQCEIILVDDGSNNNALTQKLIATINSWPASAKMVCFKENHGRSRARNYGVSIANGEYILFLDADMVPAYDDYLQKYFEIINRKSAAIVFGGFVTHEIVTNHDTLLHHNLAKSGDCRPIWQRKALGAYAIASNNLLVQCKVLDEVKFDVDFKDWGWEDTEWGLRATAYGYGLVHIDNPAIHKGLDTTKTMLKKYREAGPNLALLYRKHPIVGRFPSVKIARILAKFPFHTAFRTIAAGVAIDKSKLWPLAIRRMAIKFWRASWAADSIKI